MIVATKIPHVETGDPFAPSILCEICGCDLGDSRPLNKLWRFVYTVRIAGGYTDLLTVCGRCSTGVAEAMVRHVEDAKLARQPASRPLHEVTTLAAAGG